jgi:hypothetical protein
LHQRLHQRGETGASRPRGRARRRPARLVATGSGATRRYAGEWPAGVA